MKIRIYLAAAICLAFGPKIIAEEEEDTDLGDLGFFSDAKNNLKFGFRLATGPKVHFGNLGTVPFPNPIALPSSGEVDRKYTDGGVIKDSLRITGPQNEADSAGRQTSAPGGVYYVTDTNNVTTGPYLSYTPGQTRYWSYSNASQVVALGNGTGIAMNSYSATSAGAGFDTKSKYSSGVELQVERLLGKLGKHWEVNLVAGLAISTISGNKAGDVQSTLNSVQDIFLLNLQPDQGIPAAGYIAPTFTALTLPDNTVVGSGVETTVPLATVPDATSHRETSTPGAANVNGVWKISGAYYIMRVGPELRAMLTKDISINTSIGFSAAYAGSVYSATESFTVTGVTDPISVSEDSVASKYFSGYYANMDAQWQLNDRAGVFAGVSYESIGNYSQSVGGRTAKIDLSGTVGVRGGLSIKF